LALLISVGHQPKYLSDSILFLGKKY